MSAKEGITGEKGLELALANGEDPNADLNDVDKSDTKAAAGVSMRIQGASYTDIARVLGYSSAYRARAAVERALASAADSVEEKEQMRFIISKRLDRLLAAHMPQALDPTNPNQLAFSARALAVIDRQARLHGVDAPTQIQISATDEEILQLVEQFSPQAEADRKVVEADIIEADIIDE